ncbi:hypothetical protein ACLS0M_04895 [Avibacterium avium]|uniref:hypothetical protein n=1 Tax=Avibacterium avium TaxID=751 RepID=UPI003BF7F6F6
MPRRRSEELTPRKQAFVQKYVELGNAKLAYIATHENAAKKNEVANLALMDIQALRQEFKRLAIYLETKDELLYLPAVDVKGGLGQ